MIPSAVEATIYLANLRGCSQNEWFRSYHTLNFGNYQLESRKPLGNLVAVNEDTLREGTTMVHSVSEDTLVILLPLIGAMTYKSSLAPEGMVDVGQVRVLFLSAHSTLKISNPYKGELINFLQLWFTFTDGIKDIAKTYITEFDWIDKSNELISLHAFGINKGKQTRLSIGNYKGRKGGTYRLKDVQKGVFVFVIEGVFEVQDRLLQSRDSLMIWNTPEIEYEALSSDAIILVVDL